MAADPLWRYECRRPQGISQFTSAVRWSSTGLAIVAIYGETLPAASCMAASNEPVIRAETVVLLPCADGMHFDTQRALTNFCHRDS